MRDVSSHDSRHDEEVNEFKELQAHHHFQRRHRASGELELGATEIIEGRFDIQRQVVASSGLADSKLRHLWEQIRPDLVSALFAEAVGVWFYCIAGETATATFVLTTAAGQTQGNLTMIGFAYALGITFAIVVAGSTSGGHFHPAITIAQVIFKGFPLRKAPLYIFAQLVGGFVAALMVYAMYKFEMDSFGAELIAGGKRAQIFTPQGPAGIIAIFNTPGRPLGQVFATEFFADTFIAMVIWSQLDSQNIFVQPASAPFTIGLSFAVAVWGFSTGTIVTNTARDLGARFACGAIYKTSECFPARYSALAALTNIPATLFGVSLYTFLLSDTRRPPAAIALGHVHDDELRRYERNTSKHDELLDARIERAISKGVDPHKLVSKRSKVPSVSSAKPVRQL
ncbi:aquaporin-like protein [Acaromyces ingoldii]|uniref:Aquaporin-like protein n=1 Tax=Acaromyces ingoldii TaxID=215250 RepID=A0A316YBW9_9BASI|nr:aquaporin-like protein [Acaromyces ingoldii]PWN86782.1 aquaporin-like protein [Acaromyces ingoldii]